MPIGVDPKVDYAFKRVFGREQNTDILCALLNAILQPTPDRRLVSAEILNPFLDQETDDDKLAILDIKARDQLGRLYNIEMQMRCVPPGKREIDCLGELSEAVLGADDEDPTRRRLALDVAPALELDPDLQPRRRHPR